MVFWGDTMGCPIVIRVHTPRLALATRARVATTVDRVDEALRKFRDKEIGLIESNLRQVESDLEFSVETFIRLLSFVNK